MVKKELGDELNELNKAVEFKGSLWGFKPLWPMMSYFSTD